MLIFHFATNDQVVKRMDKHIALSDKCFIMKFAVAPVFRCPQNKILWIVNGDMRKILSLFVDLRIVAEI